MLISFSRRFNKEYNKSSIKIRRKFDQRLEIFNQDKFSIILNNHALAGKWQGGRSINITGDWRAIYYEVKKNEIFFIALGTHSQLYG